LRRHRDIGCRDFAAGEKTAEMVALKRWDDRGYHIPGLGIYFVDWGEIGRCLFGLTLIYLVVAIARFLRNSTAKSPDPVVSITRTAGGGFGVGASRPNVLIRADLSLRLSSAILLSRSPEEYSFGREQDFRTQFILGFYWRVMMGKTPASYYDHDHWLLKALSGSPFMVNRSEKRHRPGCASPISSATPTSSSARFRLRHHPGVHLLSIERRRLLAKLECAGARVTDCSPS
jgi:hypothetical protein